jgi:hypothetical protein
MFLSEFEHFSMQTSFTNQIRNVQCQNSVGYDTTETMMWCIINDESSVLEFFDL